MKLPTFIETFKIRVWDLIELKIRVWDLIEKLKIRVWDLIEELKIKSLGPYQKRIGQVIGFKVRYL